MSTDIRKVHLECTQGTSFKEYNIYVTQRLNGKYDLLSTYGRIGGNLINREIKTDLGLAEAMSEYKKVLRSKERKGYEIVTQEDASRFTSRYVETLTQKAAVLVAEGILERNHYEGLKKLLQASDAETLEMAEKIVFANEEKLRQAA